MRAATQLEISDLSHSVDIGFLRINASPAKQALITCATKWIYAYTSFLGDFVVGRLVWLANFITNANATLQLGFMSRSSGQALSREELVTVMDCMRSVKDLQTVVLDYVQESMEIVGLCQSHAYVLPVSVHVGSMLFT